MRVLVTGAGGRIGTRLTSRLLDEGHAVRAFGLVGDAALGALSDLGVEVFTGRLEDAASVRPAVDGVDAIFHLAAALTTHDLRDEEFVSANLQGTFNLLCAARDLVPDLRRFVYASSDAVYWPGLSSPAAYLPVDESHPLLAGSVYGATKVGAEQLCTAFWRTYGLPPVVMRPTATANPDELIRPNSVFGRRWFLRSAIAWHEGRTRLSAGEQSLLAKLRRADDGTDKLFALTEPEGTPSLNMLTDARDVAAGMHAMLEPPEAVGQAFNIGPDAPHANTVFVEYLADRLSMDWVPVRYEGIRPIGYIGDWYVSSAKARGVLDYRPTRTVFDMIDEAVEAATASSAVSG